MSICNNGWASERSLRGVGKSGRGSIPQHADPPDEMPQEGRWRKDLGAGDRCIVLVHVEHLESRTVHDEDM